MDKILFFDVSNEGHHFLYNSAVMSGLRESNKTTKIYYYSPLSDLKKKNELKNNGIQLLLSNFKKVGTINRVKMLLNIYFYAKKNKIKHIHLLYLDNLILSFFLLFPLFLGFKVTATLHWFPNKNIKQKILKILLKINSIKKIIVHGNYTKIKIEDLIKVKEKVFPVVYPNLHSDELNYEVLNRIQHSLSNHSKPYLLAFGGLRHDKGIDILLEALPEVTGDYTLIIAGKEDFFSIDKIKQFIDNYELGKKVFCDIRFISDSELSAYFTLTDVVILPYRKYFTGQSGPLTEGVTRSKIIIGPNTGEIGYTIDRYNLGVTFDVENPSDLARQIQRVLDNLNSINKEILTNQIKYKNFLSKSYFVKSYNYFFNEK